MTEEQEDEEGQEEEGMTYTETYLMCDRCCRSFPKVVATYERNMKASVVLRYAKRQGWKRTRSPLGEVKDLCPECFGKEPPKVSALARVK